MDWNGNAGAIAFVAGVVGAVGSAAVTYALTTMAHTIRDLERRLTEAERRPRSKFEQDADLDRRAQAMNVATL